MMELNEIERVEVKTIIRDIRPINMAWVGATVLPKTESVGEMWIMA
jgi:actin-related protein 8